MDKSYEGYEKQSAAHRICHRSAFRGQIPLSRDGICRSSANIIIARRARWRCAAHFEGVVIAFLISLLVWSIVGFAFVDAQSYIIPGSAASAAGYSNSVSSYTGGLSSGASYVSYQGSTNVNRYYTSDQINTYWPILGNAATCNARQDILLQVAPLGCQPTVVRSDILEEQNVPVFCQIMALDVNPLNDVNKIRNIRFIGNYPPEVAGVGFHPARAALNTREVLTGSPLMDNIGYVVVVLKKAPNEKSMPDSVNVTLVAQLEYGTSNSLGVGRTEFLLRPVSDKDWETEKLKQSFWNGRYFVKLEEVDSNTALISIYDGVQRLTTQRVNRGETSQPVYLPGAFCSAGYQIAYDDYVAADNSAKIELSSEKGTDVFQVYERMTFADGMCTITSIDDSGGGGGKVNGYCNNGRSFTLQLNSGSATSYGAFAAGGNMTTPQLIGDGSYEIRISGSKAGSKEGTYDLKQDNSLWGVSKASGTSEIKELISREGRFNNESLTLMKLEKDKGWLYDLRAQMMDYRTRITSDPDFMKRTLRERPLNGDVQKKLNDAIADYEKVANDFPAETLGTRKTGEIALQEAIDLAAKFGADSTRARLIELYLRNYPDGQFAMKYSADRDTLNKLDSSLAGETMQINGVVYMIRLLSIDQPAKQATVDLNIGDKTDVFALKEEKEFYYRGELKGKIKVEEIKADQVRLTAFCMNNSAGTVSTRSYLLNYGAYNYGATGSYYGTTSTSLLGTTYAGTSSTQTICDSTPASVRSLNVERVARIRILPLARGVESSTNFTVNIGIEKRAIKLSPDEAQEKIDRLNKTIKKWEDISNKLGNVVKGLKAACFATATALMAKNFFTGLNGESIARQDVMQKEGGWKQQCSDMVGKGQYATMDACYLANAGKIDSDVSARTAAINKVNADIQAVQAKHPTTTGGDLFGQAVDTDAVRADYANQVMSKCGGMTINVSGVRNSQYGSSGSTTVNDLLAGDNVKNNVVTLQDLRQIATECELRSSSSGLTRTISDKSLSDVANRVNNNLVVQKEIDSDNKNRATGLGKAFYASPQSQTDKMAEVVTKPANLAGLSFGEGITHSSTVIVPGHDSSAAGGTAKGGEAVKFDAGTYVLGLQQGDARKGVYTVSEVWKKVGDTYTQEDAKSFTTAYGIGAIRDEGRVSYNNQMSAADMKVRYYENGPYKGLPAIVPFDSRQGWYAATQQTLPAFNNGASTFDASGRVTSFWVCNVGENRRIEFETGFGDDICQMVNPYTGQSYNYFPGLDEQASKILIQKAQMAIQDAARQYGTGVKYVTINGERFEVGNPATGAASTQCQDFMSPTDCLIMFNVCDPVICPSSRCNLGGAYPVADVVQTGIVGSALLCLPNIREGIAIPVCLTGIQAGIDTLVSIMKNYRDCLQENINTGRMVGICDEIYSIYLCEFLWKQIVPFVNILIPKIIEMAYGQGVRGGGEYLTVMGAWQNTEKSIDYFTQNYAVNSMKAFQARNVEEAGTEICKAFISVKAPTAFESLIEPDSPPQFYAWFDAQKYSDATVPATAQYKVFYHIFGGKDQGVTFLVYLRNPPQSSYYNVPAQITVATGFIARGQYASETKDFTAPEGYKELCVRINEQEKCGFQQVSSDFAINYLTDSAVAAELKNTNIQSEKECISGNSNPVSLVNPNVQAGVSEVVNPDIYNRGVVRVCSTTNPGSGTNPSRFVDVGQCDNSKIRCWLDRTSVNNALSASAVGIKNETLQTLDERAREVLGNNLAVLNEEEAIAEIDNLRIAFGNMKSRGAFDTEVGALIDRINYVYDKLYLNSHKAEVLLLRAQVKAEIANRALVTSGAQAAGGVSSGFSLSSERDADGKIRLMYNGTLTNYYAHASGDLYYKTSGGEYKPIGVVYSDGTMVLNQDGFSIISDLNEANKVNGAKITNWNLGTGSGPTNGISVGKYVFTISSKNADGLIRLSTGGKVTDYYVKDSNFYYSGDGVNLGEIIGYVDSGGKVSLNSVAIGVITDNTEESMVDGATISGWNNPQAQEETPQTGLPSGEYNPVDIIKSSGSKPVFDSEGRLKVDFGGSIGSYGISASDKLEWWNGGSLGGNWIDVDGKYKDESLSDNDRKWLVELKSEFVQAKQSEKGQAFLDRIVDLVDGERRYTLTSGSAGGGETLDDVSAKECVNQPTGGNMIYESNKARESLRRDSRLPEGMVLKIPKECSSTPPDNANPNTPVSGGTKYYSLGGAQGDSKREIFYGGETTRVYLEGGNTLRYVNGKVVGTIREGKINVPSYEVREVNADAINHLKAMNGGSYSDLAAGKLAANPNPIAAQTPATPVADNPPASPQPTPTPSKFPIKGFVGSSVVMFNDYDLKDCGTAVETAKEKGAKGVNFIPTIYADIDSKNNVKGYYLKRIVNDADSYVAVSPEVISELTSDMTSCLQIAYNNRLAITTTPHLDFKPGGAGKDWRNSYVFNPTAKINGYSYQDVLLEPIANAVLSLPKDAQVDFAMQGEMGGTLFDYPSEWKSLVENYKSRFSEYSNIRAGIDTNYNKVAGNEADWNDNGWFTNPNLGPAHDKTKFQNLLASVQFIGFSAYGQVGNPVTIENFRGLLNGYKYIYSKNGVTFPNVPVKFSEVGVGGGAKAGSCGDGNTINNCPWEGPSSKEKSCPVLWGNSANEKFRESYYTALTQFLQTGAIDSAYVWNLDTWDAQGVYRTSQACGSPQIVAIIKNYNGNIA